MCVCVCVCVCVCECVCVTQLTIPIRFLVDEPRPPWTLASPRVAVGACVWVEDEAVSAPQQEESKGGRGVVEESRGLQWLVQC